MALISNLNPDAQTVTVQFDLNRLNLADRALDTVNALTDEPIEMGADGVVSVALGSEDWIYVWLRPAGDE